MAQEGCAGCAGVPIRPSPSSMCVLLGQNNLPANAKALPCDQFAARQGVLLDKAGKNGLDR